METGEDAKLVCWLVLIVVLSTGLMLGVLAQTTKLNAPENVVRRNGYRDAINQQAYDEGYKSGLKYIKEKGGHVD